MKSEQKYCEHCNKNVLAHKASADIGCFCHFGHLCLTICTGLLWGIVWILHANYDNNKFRCSICGSVCK